MSARLILGGLAQGAGAGIAQYGVQLREAKLAAISRETTERRILEDRSFRGRQADIDRTFRSGEAAKDRDFRAGEAVKDRNFRDEDREDRQTFAGSEGQANRDANSGLVDARTRLTNAQAGNAERGLGGGANSAAVQNREHLRGLYMRSSEGQRLSGETDADYQKRVNDWILKIETQRDSKSEDDLWLEAVKLAQGDTLVATEGPDAVRKRAQELFDLMTGNSARQQAQPTAAPASGPQSGLSGAGTEENPYQASSQADIDWFKNNAPAGSVIIVNGKLYRK